VSGNFDFFSTFPESQFNNPFFALLTINKHQKRHFWLVPPPVNEIQSWNSLEFIGFIIIQLSVLNLAESLILFTNIEVYITQICVFFVPLTQMPSTLIL